MIDIDTARIENFIETKPNKNGVSFLKALLVLLVMAAVLADFAYLLISAGHARIKENAETAEPIITYTEAVTKEESIKWQEGWVKYNNEIYAYKENVMTFLVMGIDQTSQKENAGIISGGNADVLMLLVLDPDEKKIELIPINKNTMTNPPVSKAGNTDNESGIAQISTWHDMGDGGASSCEYEVDAVSNLFYQLPIHGYAAMNMEGIIPLNDSVGGIDVVAPSDYSSGDISVSAGDELHLNGEDAYWFVRSFDHQTGGDNRRLQRQTVYLNALVSKVYDFIKNDPITFMSVYGSIEDYVVTNVTNSELIYLATEASRYEFDQSSIYEMYGETVSGEYGDEFYPDEEALRKLIIDVYYEKVEQ